MAPPKHLHPLVTLFRAQTRSLEDAVLTLIGERELDTGEITETGSEITETGSRAWGRLDRLDRGEQQTRHAKRPGAVTTIRFAARRSAHELPWGALDEGAILPP